MGGADVCEGRKNDGAFGGVTACVGRDEVHGAEACRGRDVTIIKNARIVDAESDFYGSIVFSEEGIIEVAPEVKSASVSECACGSVAGSYGTGSRDFDALLARFPNATVIDAAGKTVMPAFIDMHVHFRYPGQTQKEDLFSGSRAAAAGGVGTVVLMPNTTPVVSSLETALSINEEVKRIGLIDAFQTVSITDGFSGNDTHHLDEVCRAFPAVPVITEDGKDVLEASVMEEAMRKCADKGIIVSCHCEDPALVPTAKQFRAEKRFREAEKVLADAENTFTERNIELALKAGCRVHIAHASTKAALEAVRRAKKSAPGSKLVTCEVTPHHIALSNTADELCAELVNPPLRSEEDRLAVIQAILDGTADVISTDHAPHTADDKASGACGFTGIELSFAVCNTTLVKSGIITLSKLSSLMSAVPAKLLGLKKGRLLPGYPADIVLVDADCEQIVDSAKFFSKGKYTPFNGKKLTGKVLRTFHGGKQVFNAE